VGRRPFRLGSICVVCVYGVVVFLSLIIIDVHRVLSMRMLLVVLDVVAGIRRCVVVVGAFCLT